MDWAGYPDWSKPFSVGGRLLFAAYEQPNQFVAPPVALDAVAPDRRSPLQLDVYRQDRGPGGLTHFGLLTIRFSARYELEAVRDDLWTRHSNARVEALLAESGLLRLTAVEALGLPEAVLAPQPLDPAGVGSLLLSIRLDGPATDLFVGALARGLSTIGAQVWVAARGVAARTAGKVTFDPAAFLASAGAAFGNTDAIAVDALHAKLADSPETLSLKLSTPVESEHRRAFADAVLDRIVGRFAALVCPPQETTGTWIRLDATAMRPGEISWTLSDPVLAPRLFTLQADPLGPLRTMPPGDIEDHVVWRHDVAALASGRRTLTIRTTLPPRHVGLLKATVEIEAPPVPPARPATVRATVPLDPEKESATAELRLAVTEPLSFDWHTVAFLIDSGKVESIQGPARHHAGEHLVVTPEDFGLRFVTVAAEPSLLVEAQVTVQCTGMRKGRPWTLRGVLEKTEPELALTVPQDVTEMRISATATALTGGAERHMAPLPTGPLRIDPFSFEGSGPRSLDVACIFDDPAPEALLEFAPEDRSDQAATHQLLRLTPSTPKSQWTWLALSPFRSGYRWRWAGSAAWSDPLSPDAPLRVRSSDRPAMGDTETPMSEEIEIEGIRLAPVKGQPSTWSYQPTKAGIAQHAGGRKQFTLIQAGSVAMLTMTAMWGVPPETLESVRQAVAAKIGTPAKRVILSHAAVEVGQVQLLIGDGAGGFTPLASAGSSGAPPYNAAFNLTLDAGQLEKVKKAVQGARGWLAVRYVVNETAPMSHTTTASASTSTSASGGIFRATGGSSDSASFASETAMSAESTEATGQSTPRAMQFQTDAADWGLAG